MFLGVPGVQVLFANKNNRLIWNTPFSEGCSGVPEIYRDISSEHLEHLGTPWPIASNQLISLQEHLGTPWNTQK
jgi:hypothetical protein